MKNKVCTILFVMVFFGCHFPKAIEPKMGVTNELRTGDKIYFTTYSTMGVNKDEYPDPDYVYDIDTTFFKYLKTKTEDDSTAGGIETTKDYYLAIKKGKTSISVQKYTYHRNDADSLIKVAEKPLIYSFEIL